MDDQYRKIASAAVLKALPNYAGKVDPKVLSLRRVIWPYHFSADIQCSLSTCGQWHREGVIVELSDGRITNIGHVCGGRPENFGDEYFRLKSEFSGAKLKEKMMPVLLDRALLQSISSSVNKVLGSTEVWIARAAIFSRNFPSITRHIARQLAQSQALNIDEELERSESEIEAMLEDGRASNRQSARYYRVRRGTIRGASFLALRASPLEKIAQRADALCRADPLGADMPTLHKLYSDCLNLPDEISEFRSQVEQAHLFLEAGNISLFQYISMPVDEKKRLQHLSLAWIEQQRLMKSEPTPNAGEKRPLSKRQRDIYRRCGIKAPAYREDI